jgi:hypothetical protein
MKDNDEKNQGKIIETNSDTAEDTAQNAGQSETAEDTAQNAGQGDIADKNNVIKFDALAAFKKSREQAYKDALKEESAETEAAAEAERKKREAYAKKLADEHRDLLKLKAGVASDEIIQEFSPEEKDDTKPPLSKRITNIWFHYKATIIVSALVVIAIVYLIGTIVFAVRPDIRILIIKTDPNLILITEDIADALAPYCPDFNGDGKIYLQVAYNPAIPAEGTDPNYTQAQSARLYVEFNAPDSALLFTDEAALNALGVSADLFDDPKEWFGDSPDINSFGYSVDATNLDELVGYPELGVDMYAAFRTPVTGNALMGDYEDFQTNNANAHTLWENFITGKVINPGAVSYSE